jgi:hypothetical protein
MTDEVTRNIARREIIAENHFHIRGFFVRIIWVRRGIWCFRIGGEWTAGFTICCGESFPQERLR